MNNNKQTCSITRVEFLTEDCTFANNVVNDFPAFVFPSVTNPLIFFVYLAYYVYEPCEKIYYCYFVLLE